MQAAEAIKRAHSIEWEHIMAAQHFGRQFECWRTPLCENSRARMYKGRKCCEKIDKRFQHVVLYNL